MRKSNKGFTLAEVLLSIGLAAVALLALVAHSTLLVGANQKRENLTAGSDVAFSILKRLVGQIRADSPAGRRSAAYNQNSVISTFDTGTENISGTDFNWELFLSNVNDSLSGSPVGTGPTGAESTTRLKQAEIVVSWWAQANNTRQGQGKLEVKAVKLIKVSNGP